MKPFDIRIDEYDNVIDNLEMAAHFLEHISPSIKWKWVTIAIYQALYGFLICALQGTDARQTVYDKRKDSGKAASLHAHRVPKNVIAASFGVSEQMVDKWLAEPYLIGIDEAINRAKKKDSFIWSDCKPLVTTPDDDAAIIELVKCFRNEFEHFAPKHWSLDTSQIHLAICRVLRVIRFIALESNCVVFADDKQEQRARAAFSKLDSMLNETPPV